MKAVVASVKTEELARAQDGAEVGTQDCNARKEH
jgi:hypothetical protein